MAALLLVKQLVGWSAGRLVGSAGAPVKRSSDKAALDPARYNTYQYERNCFASHQCWEKALKKTGNSFGGVMLGDAVSVATSGIPAYKIGDAMFMGGALGKVVTVANAQAAAKKEPIVAIEQVSGR